MRPKRGASEQTQLIGTRAITEGIARRFSRMSHPATILSHRPPPRAGRRETILRESTTVPASLPPRLSVIALAEFDTASVCDTASPC
jgi:hypothetical protein